MIQNRLNDKEKDVQGLKKQTSSLLNCAWEKGYVAGFDDGYKTGRQAEERPKGKWIEYDDDGLYAGECSCCKWKAVLYESNVLYMNFCPNCGADMSGDEPKSELSKSIDDMYNKLRGGL